MSTSTKTIEHEFEFDNGGQILVAHCELTYVIRHEAATQRYPQSDLGCPASSSPKLLELTVDRVSLFPRGTDDIVELTDHGTFGPLFAYLGNQIVSTTDESEFESIYDWKADR